MAFTYCGISPDHGVSAVYEIKVVLFDETEEKYILSGYFPRVIEYIKSTGNYNRIASLSIIPMDGVAHAESLWGKS